ncbi:AEC family transporter [Roseateles sp.]|uniref:AEC family transporter n=1 Tax=Roseateles sp. TaxID=1971397 RepID=UPI0039299DA1
MQAVLAVTFPFFALVLAGWLAARSGRVHASTIPGLNSFVLFFALPCMLFRFGRDTPLQQLVSPSLLGVYALAALGLVALGWGVAVLLGVGRKDAAFGALVAAFPNSGFMGVPLLLALLGQGAMGPVICTLLVDLFLTSSLCLALSQAGEPGGNGLRAFGQALRAVLGNPMPWGIALGAALGASGWHLPGPVDKVIDLLGQAASPVALFTIGAVLFVSGRQAGGGRPQVDEWLIALAKLALHPALVYGLGLLAGVAPAPLAALTLTAALPSASNVALLTERHAANTGRVARIIMITTALSFLSFSGLAAWLMP